MVAFLQRTATHPPCALGLLADLEPSECPPPLRPRCVVLPGTVLSLLLIPSRAARLLHDPMVAIPGFSEPQAGGGWSTSPRMSQGVWDSQEREDTLLQVSRKQWCLTAFAESAAGPYSLDSSSLAESFTCPAL